MKQFKFFQDEKVTLWQRTYITVEAESEEEALKKIEPFKTEIADSYDYGIDITCDEYLFDTVSSLSVDENRGFATIEFYKSNGEYIGGNGKH